MDSNFASLVESFPAKLEELLKQEKVKISDIPTQPIVSGIYLLSERNNDLYIGRSVNIRRRLRLQAFGAHNQSSFAFLLARHKTGSETSYSGKGTRKELMKLKSFVNAFEEAQERIQKMDVRFVEESDPVKQCLLEVYAAIALKTEFNSFKTS